MGGAEGGESAGGWLDDGHGLDVTVEILTAVRVDNWLS